MQRQNDGVTWVQKTQKDSHHWGVTEAQKGVNLQMAEAERLADKSLIGCCV